MESDIYLSMQSAYRDVYLKEGPIDFLRNNIFYDKKKQQEIHQNEKRKAEARKAKAGRGGGKGKDYGYDPNKGTSTFRDGSNRIFARKGGKPGYMKKGDPSSWFPYDASERGAQQAARRHDTIKKANAPKPKPKPKDPPKAQPKVKEPRNRLPSASDMMSGSRKPGSQQQTQQKNQQSKPQLKPGDKGYNPKTNKSFKDSPGKQGTSKGAPIVPGVKVKKDSPKPNPPAAPPKPALKPAPKPQSSDMGSNYRAWTRANTKLARNVKKGSAGYDDIKDELSKIDSKNESMDNTQKWHSMADAYRNVYQPQQQAQEDVNITAYPAVPRKLEVTKNTVNIEVNKQQTKVGEVEKAYYTYPAGFDATNREDVAKEQKQDGSTARYPTVQKEEAIQIVGDYLLDQGIVEEPESVDAFFEHMTDEWKSAIIEGAMEKTMAALKKQYGHDPEANRKRKAMMMKKKGMAKKPGAKMPKMPMDKAMGYGMNKYQGD